VITDHIRYTIGRNNSTVFLPSLVPLVDEFLPEQFFDSDSKMRQTTGNALVQTNLSLLTTMITFVIVAVHGNTSSTPFVLNKQKITPNEVETKSFARVSSNPLSANVEAM
jgi:hypothetical protein